VTDFIKAPSSRSQGIVQNLAVGASAASLPNKFGVQTHQIRLSSTTGCFFVISEAAAPVAATASNGSYLAPNVAAEYLIVTPGQVLSAIQASASGTLSVTEMS
jgi:hypothetical protein